MVVLVTLSSGDRKIQINALLDLGATGYAFVDAAFANKVCETL